MASMTSNRRFLRAIVLLAALSTAAASAPGYCEPGQAIPRRPLPGCRWYVSSQTCGGAPRLPFAVMKERCCRELEAVAPECRCKALRSMMDDMSVHPEAGVEPEMMMERQECWHAQAEFAATVVSERECGLLTIHGSQFCYDLGAEY